MKTRCEQCNANLQTGVNVLGLQEGILGSSGFVELEDRKVFCNEECLAEYLATLRRDVWKVKRRIP